MESTANQTSTEALALEAERIVGAAEAAELEHARDTEVPAADAAAEIAGLMMVVGSFLAMRWPSCSKVWAPAECEHHARLISPAVVKAGWWTAGADSAVYVAALGSAAALGLATMDAIRADRAKEPDRPEREKPQAPVIERTDPSSIHTRA